jgi:hypothetical protein
MWTDFSTNPELVWGKVKAARIGDGNNSDQAVFGYYLTEQLSGNRTEQKDIPTWGPPDVQPFYKVKCFAEGAALPSGCRAVLFFGSDKPDHEAVQKQCPWVTEHWR